MKNEKINRFSGKFFRSERGQAMAEYALMLGVLLFMLVVAKQVGSTANRFFQWVVNAFQ